MYLRFIAGAAAAFLVMAGYTEASAARTINGYRHAAARHRSCCMTVGGYYGQLGYHYYGVPSSRYPFVNGSAYNYPGYLNNQTFWERVVTQRNYPVQY